MPKRSLLYGTIAGLIAVAIIFAFMNLRQSMPPAAGLSAGTEAQGEVPIGGAFSLVNGAGERVTNKDFLGRYMLVYFGYTFCPDVCPLDLQKLTMALDLLRAENVDLSVLQPIFITIDPERDSPEVMAEYVSNFDPSLIGLSGTADDIGSAARAYRVYYARAEPESGSDRDDGNYMMNHSSYIYLMGPDGKYRDHFTSLDSPESIAETLEEILP